MTGMKYTDENMKYLRLLAEKYPSERSLTREIINLTAILNLPKGTEHFMSDIHGEYEAFCHILNNCSGVIREKVEALYSDTLTHDQIKELCTLIYYPAEKLSLIKRSRGTDSEWYRTTLEQMIEIARVLSSKYTRSKISPTIWSRSTASLLISPASEIIKSSPLILMIVSRILL